MFLRSYFIHTHFGELLHSYMFWGAIAFIYVLGSYCIHKCFVDIIMFWEPIFIKSVWEMGRTIFIRSVWEMGRTIFIRSVWEVGRAVFIRSVWEVGESYFH